jgi:hypothetical protein
MPVQAFSTKVYCGFSSRRFFSDLREAHRRGLVPPVAHFNSVNHYMADRS